MSSDGSVPQMTCLSCGSPYLSDNGDRWKCRSCGFDGVIEHFNPIRDDDAPAEAARLEDAVCSNHPGKKAVAICAGTGDYICSLCRVTVHGNDYSVQYLDRGGKILASQTFSQYMPRPDRLVGIMLIFSLLFTFVSPILFVYSCVCLVRALRMRRTDAIFAKVMSPARMWFSWSLNLLLSVSMFLVYGLAIIGAVAEVSRVS